MKRASDLPTATPEISATDGPPAPPEIAANDGAPHPHQIGANDGTPRPHQIAAIDRPVPAPRRTPTRPRGARAPARSWSMGWPARALRAALWPTLLEPFVRSFYTLRAFGAERLDDLAGPAIFAANHCAHLDNAFIIMCLPRPWRTRLAIAAATADIFGPRHLGLPIKGALAQLLGNAFPFTQRGRGPARMDHLHSLLEQGWSVLLFPEGKLTVGGPMQRFKPGIGLVATETAAPIVPVKVEIVQPGPWEGAGRFARGIVEIRFGAPLRVDPAADAVAFTQRLEAAVRGL